MEEKGSDAQGSAAVGVGPLVFISHDSKDAELADAFSKLLKSVSAGMIKTFHSSNKKVGDGIDFGEEWYKRLMAQLQITSDVVCLFTERSLDRPWILFEAGVAKGKLDTPVMGVAMGVPLNRVSAGPFYQFQNMDDSEGDLTKLVNQLARRVPGLELDPDVLSAQVQAFKSAEAAIIKKLDGVTEKKKESPRAVEEASVAKLVEEMKSLPSRVAERLTEDSFSARHGRFRRIHPMMLEELIHLPGDPGAPAGILLAASLVKEEMPWLYELAMEVYRAVKSGDAEAALLDIERLRRISEIMANSPFVDAYSRKESQIIAMEFPRMLERALRHSLEVRGRPVIRMRKSSTELDSK